MENKEGNKDGKKTNKRELVHYACLAKAEEALGTEFDIRKFHDTVLSLGSVPLPVLETRIDQFIANGGPGLPGVEYD